MKFNIKYIFLSLLPLVMAGMFLASCQKDDLPNNGEPVIYYIRNTDPTKADSLYGAAKLGSLIAIIGDNLGGTNKIMFNDQEAALTPTFVTNKSILVSVPGDAPIVKTDKMTLYFKNGKTLEYDLEIKISAPVLDNMKNEWAQEGETAVINGNYFFEPITIKLADGATVDPASITQTQITFVVPANAAEGAITVTTNFGATVSAFQLYDKRNTILNYDDLVPTGSWRPGTFVQDDNSIDGKYLYLMGTYSAGDGRNEGASPNSTYESQYWPKTAGRAAGNFLPGNPNDYSLKFECKVIDWYGSYLNFCFAPYGFEGASGSNQEIWSNSYNARAIWGPWDVADADYSTDGQWITVVIPMTDFKYAMGTSGSDVVYTPMAFNPDNTGSLSLWMLPAPKAKSNSPFEVYIDNVRIVPNKVK